MYESKSFKFILFVVFYITCYNQTINIILIGETDMELQFILQNAVLSIESLKDYYFSQIDRITKDVEKKISKYVPGTMIDRYLFAKATKQEELLADETGNEIKKLAETLLSDVTINEIESGYSISYKINEKFVDDSKYEFHPSIASREYRKLSERIEILNDSTLISLLIKYEETIAGIFKYIISKFPTAYLNNKTLSYSEIMEINSQINSVKEILLDREIEEIMRMPISNWYKILKEKHKFNFDNLDKYFTEFKEIYYRRNVLVHNNGRINISYLNGIEEKPHGDLKPGMPLPVNKDYLNKAFNLTYIMIYGTILDVSGIYNEGYALHESFHNYAFQHMVDKEWEISFYIYQNIMEIKTPATPSIDIEMRKINYWISMKNLYGLDAIREEVLSYDVSAMEGEFKVAKACLLDDYKEITALLEIYLNTNVYPQNIENWPLFIQYRKSSEYKRFKKEHASDFRKQFYTAEDIKREDVSEEILEKSEELSV